MGCHLWLYKLRFIVRFSRYIAVWMLNWYALCVCVCVCVCVWGGGGGGGGGGGVGLPIICIQSHDGNTPMKNSKKYNSNNFMKRFFKTLINLGLYMSRVFPLMQNYYILSIDRDMDHPFIKRPAVGWDLYIQVTTGEQGRREGSIQY